ncbi:hypothetical protein FAI40_05110 [Acetobacteraceae bacterium]|nr:hypothetical protein FAI40_05110 [Acetobacteraceae bacterium]
MKKRKNHKRAKYFSSYTFFLLAFPMMMAGCYHRGPIDVWTDWIHQMRGGVGTGVLPPAPGTHGAYPFVGDVPAENPEFPTKEAQLAMTQKLQSDRNKAIRHAAETGDITFPKVAPPPPMSDLAGNLVMGDNDGTANKDDKSKKKFNRQKKAVPPPPKPMTLPEPSPEEAEEITDLNTPAPASLSQSDPSAVPQEQAQPEQAPQQQPENAQQEQAQPQQAPPAPEKAN